MSGSAGIIFIWNYRDTNFIIDRREMIFCCQCVTNYDDNCDNFRIVLNPLQLPGHPRVINSSSQSFLWPGIHSGEVSASLHFLKNSCRYNYKYSDISQIKPNRNSLSSKIFAFHCVSPSKLSKESPIIHHPTGYKDTIHLNAEVPDVIPNLTYL